MYGGGRCAWPAPSLWPATLAHVGDVIGSGDSSITTLDLFAGAGGLTEGLRSASALFEPVRAVEHDELAAATFDANHGSGIAYAGPIETWLAEEDVPEVDLVVGGPPCQGFSQLNRSKVGLERNSLWRSYAQTLLRARPKWFVLENVPAFLKSEEFAELREATARSGWLQDWQLDAGVVLASDFGAPQNRRRALVIGHHRDLPAPSFPVGELMGVPSTVRDAIGGIDPRVTRTELPDRTVLVGDREVPGAFTSVELHLTRHYEMKSRSRFESIPPGGNRFDLPWHLQTPGWRKHTTGSADVMGRMFWDKPSVTIRTEFFKPEKGRYLHPEEDRAITHFEAARLQGFPDDYKWVGGKVAIARQIGNAVPVALGAAIGRSILSVAEQRRSA